MSASGKDILLGGGELNDRAVFVGSGIAKPSAVHVAAIGPIAMVRALASEDNDGVEGVLHDVVTTDRKLVAKEKLVLRFYSMAGVSAPHDNVAVGVELGQKYNDALGECGTPLHVNAMRVDSGDHEFDEGGTKVVRIFTSGGFRHIGFALHQFLRGMLIEVADGEGVAESSQEAEAECEYSGERLD